MPGAERKSQIAYPDHSWGDVAADPWMEIGGTTEVSHDVLRRFWVRNGGLAEDFERLAQPREQSIRKDSRYGR